MLGAKCDGRQCDQGAADQVGPELSGHAGGKAAGESGLGRAAGAASTPPVGTDGASGAVVPAGGSEAVAVASGTG